MSQFHGPLWQELMTPFSVEVQKPYFWAFLVHFPHFSENKNFPEKSGFVTFIIYEPLTSCKISEKTNEPEKCITDGLMNWLTEVNL